MEINRLGQGTRIIRSHQRDIILNAVFVFALTVGLGLWAFRSPTAISMAVATLVLIPCLGYLRSMVRVRAVLDHGSLRVWPGRARVSEIPFTEVQHIFWTKKDGTAVEVESGRLYHLPPSLENLDRFTEELVSRVQDLRNLQISGDLEMVSLDTTGAGLGGLD